MTITDLCYTYRKRAVSSQTSELEALEARLRATEERLKQTKALGLAHTSGNGPASPRRSRTPLSNNTFESSQTQGHPTQYQTPTSPLNTEFRPKTPTRPGTSKRQEAPPMPAAPPTPGTSEGEYAIPESERNGERISADYVLVDKMEMTTHSEGIRDRANRPDLSFC